MSFCLKCLKNVEYDIIEKTETHTVKELPITEVQQVSICSSCGSEIYVKDIEEQNMQKLYNKYRKIKGFLFPEDIKKIREKYQLNEAEFAKILGITEKDVIRYEKGCIQHDTINNLIYLLSFEENFKALYYKNKS